MTPHFEKGKPAADYLSELKFYRSIVRGLIETAAVKSEHTEMLKEKVKDLPGPVRATAMTEDWCGDSACNLPVLTRLFEAAGIPFLIFHGSEYAEFEKYYHDSGDDHIPVISIWDGDGKEIGRWVEQPEAVGPKKDAWKKERPEFMELYRKKDTDKEAGKQFASMYRKLLEEMAGWYSGGLWEETTREVAESVRV